MNPVLRRRLLIWLGILAFGGIAYFVVVRPDIPRRDRWSTYKADPAFQAAHPWIYDEWGAPTDSINPAEFERLLTDVDSIVLWNWPPEEEKHVIRDPEALAELRSILRVQPPEYTALCACSGRQEAVLYSGRRRIGTLGLQHYGYVESSLWESQAIVENPKALIDWLKKYDRPTNYYDFLIDESDDTRWARWKSGMPAEFQSQDPIYNLAAVVDPNALDRFRQNHPDARTQIQLLLHWYAHGAGGWNTEYYPGYEHAAKGLLMNHTTAEIVESLDTDGLTSHTLEGAARLFTERSFSKARPGEVRSLPVSLRARLLEHVRSTKAEDDYVESNRQKVAGKAFGAGI